MKDYKTIWSHQTDTGIAIFNCPVTGRHLLTLTDELDIVRVHRIAKAISEASKNGWNNGRLQMHIDVERYMGTLHDPNV
jgi:hypothetical protein